MILAQLYLKLDRNLEAETEYRKLLKRNPDNRQYYLGLEEARRINNEASKLQLYAELRITFPRSTLARRIPLNYASGEHFRILVDQYLRHALHKGAPPLFVDLRSLYTDKSKVMIIEELLLGYVSHLTSCERFDSEDVDSLAAEPASAVLWTYFYLAQHYDYLKDSVKALQYINMAIEHTPTLIELFVGKGRILKVFFILFFFFNIPFLHSFFIYFTARRESRGGLSLLGRGSIARHCRPLHKLKMCKVHAPS